MADPTERRGMDPSMDPAALYLEEVFTDRRIGTIRRLTPVKPDATRDIARPVLYVGETQVMTQVGTLPIAFEIPVATLEEAAKQFGPLAKEAIDRTMKELQELRRQAASSIVVPQGGLPPGGGDGRSGRRGRRQDSAAVGVLRSCGIRTPSSARPGCCRPIRFIADSRDEATAARLDNLEDPYRLYRCRGIMNCVDACPKGLNPTQAIGRIKSLLVKRRV